MNVLTPRRAVNFDPYSVHGPSDVKIPSEGNERAPMSSLQTRFRRSIVDCCLLRNEMQLMSDVVTLGSVHNF